MIYIVFNICTIGFRSVCEMTNGERVKKLFQNHWSILFRIQIYNRGKIDAHFSGR